MAAGQGKKKEKKMPAQRQRQKRENCKATTRDSGTEGGRRRAGGRSDKQVRNRKTRTRPATRRSSPAPARARHASPSGRDSAAPPTQARRARYVITFPPPPRRARDVSTPRASAVAWVLTPRPRPLESLPGPSAPGPSARVSRPDGGATSGCVPGRPRFREPRRVAFPALSDASERRGKLWRRRRAPLSHPPPSGPGHRSPSPEACGATTGERAPRAALEPPAPRPRAALRLLRPPARPLALASASASRFPGRRFTNKGGSPRRRRLDGARRLRPCRA